MNAVVLNHQLALHGLFALAAIHVVLITLLQVIFLLFSKHFDLAKFALNWREQTIFQVHFILRVSDLLLAPYVRASYVKVIQHLPHKVVHSYELRAFALVGTLLLLLHPLVQAVAAKGITTHAALLGLVEDLLANNTDEVLVDFSAVIELNVARTDLLLIQCYLVLLVVFHVVFFF